MFARSSSLVTVFKLSLALPDVFADWLEFVLLPVAGVAAGVVDEQAATVSNIVSKIKIFIRFIIFSMSFILPSIEFKPELRVKFL